MTSHPSKYKQCCDHDHHEHEHSGCGEVDHTCAPKDRRPSIDEARHQRTVFDVTGLCCQSEVDLIEGAIEPLAGVEDFAVNIAAGTLTIYHDGDADRVDQVTERLKKVGLTGRARQSVGRATTLEDSPFTAQFWVIIAGAILTALAATARYGLELAAPSAALFGLAIVVGGFFVFKKAFAGIRRRQFNIPILVTIAVVGAGLIGEWFEAATVIILFAFAEWLESRSMAKARSEIGALMRLAPPTALRVDDKGAVEEVDVEAIAAGDMLRIRPGTRVPVDAVIVEGRSEFDESTITGESIPVVKSEGKTIFSGTVNGGGAITARATQPASRSTLAHIIDAIEEARENQSPTEQFIDRFARVYTPAVVVAAALVALIPPLFFGALWLDWFYRALVFLVIACPCALVIATPIANVAGLARAAREGVLVKGGKYLELLGRVQAFAFDKTGTLTVGRPVVETIKPLGGLDEEALLLAAARVEADSEHHVGQAIVHAARHRMAPERFVERARQISAIVGMGIEATIDGEGIGVDGEALGRVGTLEWLESCGVRMPEDVGAGLDEMERGGRTVVGVAIGDRLAGLISMRDILRPEARRAFDALRQRGISRTYLFTGDNLATARAIGEELGLEDDEIAARLLPDDKVRRVKALGQRFKPIAMVGDGVNDAPALAGADLGVAMGAAGTDVALESADVALMGDDLERLPAAMDVGRKTTRVIYQNIVIALGLKAIFLALAIAGIATLWMAIVADMGASLIVIFNAIRLLRGGHKRSESAGQSDLIREERVVEAVG